MTVKELCKKYDLKFQTVYKKIKNHKDKELLGHITKAKGASLELDEFAADFLLPISVKILQTIDECEKVVRENDDLKGKLRSSEIITEQTEVKLSKVLDENTDLLAEINNLKSSLSDKGKKISDITEQFETERSTYEQTISALEKRVAELTEENRILSEKLEAVPKFFKKNQ